MEKEFLKACEECNIGVVKEFLSHENVDPSLNNNKALTEVASNGCVELLKLLLDDKRTNLKVNLDFALLEASIQNHPTVVRTLVCDVGVDPSVFDDMPFRQACMFGNVENVRMMLDDDRVDPTSGETQAIEFARMGGHLEIVKILLLDSRVRKKLQVLGEEYKTLLDEKLRELGAISKIKRVFPPSVVENILDLSKYCKLENVYIKKFS